MLSSPSRADLDALPRALATLAAVAEIRGARDVADEFLEAARFVDDLPLSGRRDLVKAVRRDAATPPGLAAAAVEAVRVMRDRGTVAVVTGEIARLPTDIAALLRIPDIDPADVIRAHRRHAVVTAADIAAEAAFDEARDHEHPSASVLARLAHWLPSVRGDRARLPLGRAVGIVETIEERLDDPQSFGHVQVLGSVRRFAPTVGDVEVALTHDDPAAALAAALDRLAPDDVRHHTERRAVVQLQRDEVGLRACGPAESPFVMLWHTGSPAHVRHLRQRAAGLGFDLRPRGLLAAGGQPLACATEAEIYERLRLAWVPPELRHGDDELDLAASGSLPSPVQMSHIRGDLHTHTIYSDGRDSVETMVYAARTLGYEYVAITDHSPSAAASRVLSLRRIEEQMDEVARVRERVPGIAVLYGVEVDILRDGSLDLPDHVLARLDIVLASLHEPGGDDPERLLWRYSRAIRHPLVNVVTHPANRLVGRDEGYPLDFDALFVMAVEHQTALEIDGGPGHLDLDGHLARRAVAAGVTLTVDSDCHNALRLGRQMRLGVGTARRGGVEPRHVLNTRPLDEVRAFFGEKRRRLGA